jgi:biotin synthase
MNEIEDILKKSKLSKDNIVDLLKTDKVGRNILYNKSAELKEKHLGNKVYFRGLIEFSNICFKDCLYCGIRKNNLNNKRYNLTDEQIIDAVRFAHDHDYGSIVLQSGERDDKKIY